MDIDRAVLLIEDALRSPSNRSVSITFQENVAARPTLDNLQILLEKYILSTGFDGTLSMYISDLQTGQEIHFALDAREPIAVDPDIAFTASSTIKIPILTSYFIQRGNLPIDPSTNAIILNMIKKSENPPSDELMAELDLNTGPLVVSEYMRAIGLQNTFIAGYFEVGSPLLQRFVTRGAGR